MHLVEHVAPRFFRKNGLIFDEERVAEMEATAALIYLEKKGKLPPHSSVEQARLDAEHLFRRRLRWRIQRLAPQWRTTHSLTWLMEEGGYEPQDKRLEHQPERMALIRETLRLLERSLSADGWSPGHIALYYDYERGELSVKEYAEALGVTPEAAKQRAHRARKKLQERLGYLAGSLFIVVLRLLRRLRVARHGTMVGHV